MWALWLYAAVAATILAGLIGAVFLSTDDHRKAATCTIVTIVCMWSVVEALVKIRETKRAISHDVLSKWYLLLLASALPMAVVWIAWPLRFELHLPVSVCSNNCKSSADSIDNLLFLLPGGVGVAHSLSDDETGPKQALHHDTVESGDGRWRREIGASKSSRPSPRFNFRFISRCVFVRL